MIKSKKVKTVLVIIFVILMAILLILLNRHQTLKKERDYIQVENISTFFTIASTANRYISYLSNGLRDNLNMVLSSDYNADEEISKFNNINGYMYTLKVKNIYQATISKHKVKYYIYGLLRKEDIDEFDYGTPYYLIIDVDKDDYTFKVTPYDGKVFK